MGTFLCSDKMLVRRHVITSRLLNDLINLIIKVSRLQLPGGPTRTESCFKSTLGGFIHSHGPSLDFPCMFFEGMIKIYVSDMLISQFISENQETQQSTLLGMCGTN